jgi:hypothetical protein
MNINHNLAACNALGKGEVDSSILSGSTMHVAVSLTTDAQARAAFIISVRT